MKTKALILGVILMAMSCKNKTTSSGDNSKDKLNITTHNYPENMSKIFNAHGGMDTWNMMKSLKFTMAKPNGDEITTTNLKNRNSFIEMPNHFIGFNGEDVWLKNKDTLPYKGNPRFYYNLMFYFYAMPFVLSDDGINYEDADPLVFEDKLYPGIKISYESGVGESPDDEYILYYNAKTFQMEWLGYTVTYFSKEKSKAFHFIKYGDWQTVEGLVLPKTLTWYNYENNLPTTKRNDLQFTDIILSKEILDAAIFNPPLGAKIIE